MNCSVVELQFIDNGIVFNQQYAERGFAKFQRLHPGNQYSGTGIGLALCKKIVENHEGMITVEREPGRGTTFYIYLPIDTVNLVILGAQPLNLLL